MWGALADVVSVHLPDDAEALHMSFRLGDEKCSASCSSTQASTMWMCFPETRRETIASFDDYWSPIEEGIGQIPQAYLALPEPTRRIVRAEVRARLSPFERRASTR